jgi:hypothetical protein
MLEFYAILSHRECIAEHGINPNRGAARHHYYRVRMRKRTRALEKLF